MAQGRNDIRQRISLEGDEDVNRRLQRVGKTGEEANKRLESSSRGAHAGLNSISDVAEGLREAFGGAGSFLGEASESVARLGTALRAIGGAGGGVVTAIGAITAAMGGLAVVGARVASEIQEGATRIGTSAQTYSELKFVFEQSGAGAEDFEKAMSKILEATGDAEKGANNVEGAANKIQDSAQKIGESFSDIADKFSRQRFEATRSAALGLNEQLRQIDQQEAQAKSESQTRNLADLNAISAKFGAQRVEVERQAAMRLAEERRRIAIAEAEEIHKKYQEEAERVRQFNENIIAEGDKFARGGANAFAQFGVVVRNALGNIDPGDTFIKAADEIAKIEDPAKRSAKAIELFGRRIGTRLVESLGQGAEKIRELREEARALGLTFTDIQLKIGKEFEDTLSKLGNVITATVAKMGLAFAPLFNEVTNALAGAIGKAQGPLVEASLAISNSLRPIFHDIALAIQGDTDLIGSQFIKVMATVLPAALSFATGAIGEFVNLVGLAFRGIAEVINAVFGTKVTASDIPAFALAIRALLPLLGLVAGAFTAVGIAGGPWLKILGLIGIAIAALIPLIQENWPQIQKWLVDMATGFNDWAEGVKTTFHNLVDPIIQTFEDIKNGISQKIRAISQFLDELIQKMQTAFGLPVGQAPMLPVAQEPGIENSPLSPVTFIPGHAQGGLIRGPGGIDNVPGWLTAGEFVVNREATAENLALLQAINGGLNRMPGRRRFQSGGLVETAGVGSTRAPVHLHLDGETFRMETDDATAQRVVRVARRRTATSAGRKPSWA